MKKGDTAIKYYRRKHLVEGNNCHPILIIFLCSAFADLRACLNHFHQPIFKNKQKTHPYSSGTSVICRTSIILHSLSAAQQGNHPATPHSFSQLGSIHRDAAASAGVPRGQAGLQSFQQGSQGGSVCCAPLTDPAPSSPLPSVSPVSPSCSTAPAALCTRAAWFDHSAVTISSLRSDHTISKQLH